MADGVGAEPDVTEHRKPRDHENGGSTAQDGDGKQGETSSNHGAKAEKVQTGQEEEEEKKPSKSKELWGKLGLDMGTVLMMFKYVCLVHCHKLRGLLLTFFPQGEFGTYDW
jgi:hypothetical protein